MEEEKCPKCGIAAVSVKYRERRRKGSSATAGPTSWIREYRCPVGHKWTRVMVRSSKID